VDCFYRDTIDVPSGQQEILSKYKKRFERYRNSMFTFLSEDEAQSGCTGHRFSLLCLAAPGNISPVFQACFDSEIQSRSIRAGLAARYDFSKHVEQRVA